MKKRLSSVVFRRKGFMVAQKPRILCVDDEYTNLLLLEALLVPNGYECVFAKNGREALGIVKEQRIDLALLDVMMPEINGFEAVDVLRSYDKTSDVRIVALTSIVLSPESRRRLEGKVQNITEKNKLTRSGFIAEIRKMSGK